MNKEIYQAVSAVNVAYQGDNRQEINEADKELEMMKLVYGEQAVQEVQDYYNENVIRKARQMKETKCQYYNCDGDATKSIRITIDARDVDESYCVGHYWVVATSYYGSD